MSALLEQAQLLARGELSSVELVEQALRRIEATQGPINAFRVVRAEAALEEARAADGRIAAGESGPLLGIPVAVKDDTDIAGETTAFGCVGEFEPKTKDAEVVARLKAAGAAIVGKTTTPELGQWPITEGPAFGATRNPWNHRHTPGGSSGGSAAAVAAEIVPVALGSDGLGSIRIPAAWTHLIGIKPQRGRVPTWPEQDPFNGLACIGPLARTTEDAALLLDVAAGTPGRYAPAARSDPPRLKIALAFNIPWALAPSALAEEVRKPVERLAARLAELGHEVELVRLRYGFFGVGVVPRSIGGLSTWCERLPDHSRLDPRTRHNARLGRRFDGPVMRAALALEQPLRWQLGSVFRRFDVALAPTTAQPPLQIGAIDGFGGWETDRAMIASCPYTWPWNVLGWPAINIPAGITAGNLPVGAQLLGPANSEALLISLAAQLERAERWHERRPPDSVLAMASMSEKGSN